MSQRYQHTVINELEFQGKKYFEWKNPKIPSGISCLPAWLYEIHSSTVLRKLVKISGLGLADDLSRKWQDFLAQVIQAVIKIA